MGGYKIGNIELNLKSVPSSKKEFIKKFSSIKNVGDYWEEVKRAKKSIK